jgi:hypothetical protein
MELRLVSLYLLCLISIVSNAQKMESVTWEDLFRIYRANESEKMNVILGLGFDSKEEYLIERGKLSCHNFSIRLGSGIQGEWIETITVCKGSKQVVYTTENSTFFLELRAKLINEYAFKEWDFTKEGSQIFVNDSSMIEIKTIPGIPPHELSKHIIKIKRIPQIDSRVPIAQPPLEISQATFHALIIGIDNYDLHNELTRPSADANELCALLKSSFGFVDSNIVLLTGTVSRGDIIKGLENFYALEENDNLLIFYAGHGYKVGEGANIEGYWKPSGTSQGNSESISNSELVAHLKQIRAGHILLINDACFGGSILIGQRYEDLNTINRDIMESYKKVSRQVLASAGLSETKDRSTFFKELMEVLKDNSLRFISTENLFIRISYRIEENSNMVYGRLERIGDNLGDYVFIRR